MTLLLLTVLVVSTWYFVIAAQLRASLSTRVVFSAVGASGHIVLPLTLLGALGSLFPAAVAVTVVLLCGVLVTLAGRSGGRYTALSTASSDVRTLVAALRAAFAWETALLAGLLVFAGLWIATAIAFYPPRGIDDVTYHLPPVYQAVQDGRFELLPVELRGHFAYPLNGELLFLWVTLFAHTIRWVDAPQAFLWGFSIVAVVALGRGFCLSPRGAFLAAALFVLMPVCLLQAPSNYVDVISTAWLLSALVALIEFRDTGSTAALALGGLATGLMAGTKASTLPLSVPLVAFAFFTILRVAPTHARRAAALGMFAAPLLGACAYWYLRNWVVLGNPIFPYPLRAGGTTIFDGPVEVGRSCWSVFLSDPVEAFRIALWDPGLGSFHGGFGFLFWGFAVPAVGLETVRSIREGASRNAGRLLVLSMLPVGLATLFLVGHADLFVFARLVLVIAAPAFLAFARLVDAAVMLLPGAATALRASAVGAGTAAIVLMAAARWPLMNLAPAAAEPPEQRDVSELHYLAAATWDHRSMWAAWTALDAITVDGAGLSVYHAIDWPVFWTAPSYGTRLQNQIWNFVRDPAHPPQAFLFHSWTGNPTYLGLERDRETVAADPGSRLIASEWDDATTLYVSKAALAEKRRGVKLADYYRVTRPDLVVATAESLEQMEEGTVLLASFPFAAGYLVHEADERLRNELHPVAKRDLQSRAAGLSERTVYTVGDAIAGRASTMVARLSWAGSSVALYRHEPLSGRRSR